MSLAEALEGLRATGLDGFALTDHNSIAGHAELARLAQENPRYHLIPGVEVSTREGHLLVYGAKALPPRDRSLSETLEWVRAAGGVPVLAHPFRWVHGAGQSATGSAAVPAIETLNGHGTRFTNDRAVAAAAARGLGRTGGSDAHVPREIGRAFTEFPDPTSSVEGLLSQIAQGATRAGGRPVGYGEAVGLSLGTAVRRLARGMRPI